MTSEPNRQHRKKQPVRALLLLSQPTVLALVITAIMMQWRVTTVVRVDMIVEFADCCVNETNPRFHIMVMQTTLQYRGGGFNETMLRARLASGAFFPVDVRQIIIRYPEYPEIREKITRVGGQFVVVPFDRVEIRSAACEATCQEIRIELEGRADQAYLTREHHIREDYRLTMFDEVIHSSIALGSGVIVWMVLTALGWVIVYRELKRQD